MSDKCFVDTNVLVYAHDATAGARHEKARELVERLWHDRRGVLSTQVLQELYVNVRRRARHPLALADARALLADYARWDVVVNTAESILDALEIEERYGLSFWDALIVQAAQAAAAATLYSEDLSHGQSYGSVKVVNPFADFPS
jgi:predicted nucleic acid-binding protein